MEYPKETKIKIQIENNDCKISYDNITDNNDNNDNIDNNDNNENNENNDNCEYINKNIHINSNLKTDQSNSTKKYNYPTNFDDNEISLTISHTSKNENSKNISLLEITDKSVFFADSSNNKNYPALNTTLENKEKCNNFKNKKIKIEKLNPSFLKVEKNLFPIYRKTINTENNKNSLINKILHNYHSKNNPKKSQLFSKKITKQIKLKLNVYKNQTILKKKNLCKKDINNKNSFHLNSIINNSQNLYSENKLNITNKSHISLPSNSSSMCNNSRYSYFSGTQRNTEKPFFDNNLSNCNLQKIYNINRLKRCIFLNQRRFLNTDNSNTNISNSISNTNISSTCKTSRKSSDIFLETTAKKLFNYLNSSEKNNFSTIKKIRTENKLYKKKTIIKKNLSGSRISYSKNVIKNKKPNVCVVASKNGIKMENIKKYRKKTSIGNKNNIIKSTLKLHGEKSSDNLKRKLKYCKSNSLNWDGMKNLKNILGSSNKSK